MSNVEIGLDPQQKGFSALNAEEMELHFAGKTFLGSFPPFFKYIIFLKSDGRLEGKNNTQHYDIGQWTINAENNTLSVKWDYGWESTTNHVYLEGEVFKFFDVSTGRMNTSFDQLIDSVESVKAFEI